MLYCLNSAVYCQRKCLKELKETCWEFLKRTGLFYTGLRNCLWMSLDQKKGGFRSMDCLCSSWMSHLLFQQDQCWLLLNYWTEYLVCYVVSICFPTRLKRFLVYFLYLQDVLYQHEKWVNNTTLLFYFRLCLKAQLYWYYLFGDLNGDQPRKSQLVSSHGRQNWVESNVVHVCFD